MKAFQLRRKKNTLTLSNYKSQINHQNKVDQPKNHLNATKHLFNILEPSKQNSSLNVKSTKQKKITNLFDIVELTPQFGRQQCSESISNSKQWKRSFSMTEKVRAYSKKSSFKNQNNANIVKRQSAYKPLNQNELYIKQLAIILKNNNILKENNNINYIITKQNFQLIMQQTISLSMDPHPLEQCQDKKYMSSLRILLAKIRKSHNQNINQRKGCTLGLSSNTLQFSFKSQDFQQQLNRQKMGIQTLLLIKTQLLIQRSFIAINFSQHLQKPIVQRVYFSSSVQSQNILEQKQQLLDQINNLINTFSAIKLEYKIVKEDILNYAASLQEHQLQKYIQYQPASYENVWVSQQLSQLTQTITQNSNIEMSKKCQMMNEFVRSSMQQFTTKEEELTKILSFKTKFISKFIEKMKKWRENYDIKMKCMENIRNLYFQEARNNFEMLNKFKQGVSSCKYCQHKIIDQCWGALKNCRRESGQIII